MNQQNFIYKAEPCTLHQHSQLISAAVDRLLPGPVFTRQLESLPSMADYSGGLCNLRFLRPWPDVWISPLTPTSLPSSLQQ